MFTTSVTLSDGFIIDIQKTSISDLIVPKDWRLSYGAIAADMLTSYSHAVNTTESLIEQEILSDCYVNCMVSANENDSYSPLQVWISSKLNESGT